MPTRLIRSLHLITLDPSDLSGAGPGMQPSPYPNPNAAAPTKRLDPDAMPSPIQVGDFESVV